MPNITCADCKKEFATRDEYMAHRQSPCVTLDGPQPSVQSEYYSAFKKTNNGQFKCVKCNRYFNTYSAIGYHLSKVHNIRMTPEEKVQYAREKAMRYYNEKVKKNPDTPEPTKVIGPMLVEKPVAPEPKPDTLVNAILQKESAKLIIKFCTKCNTIWDGAYSVKFCPDCGTELKEPLKRKSFQVVQ